VSRPSNAHAAILGLLREPLSEVIDTARKVVAQISYLQPAGDYVVGRWSDDGSEHHIVGHKYSDRRMLPAVSEAPATFNEVSYPLYVDASPGRVAQANLLIRAHRAGVSIDFIFMGDALEDLGASWIIKTLDVFLPPMGVDTAILCDLKDTGPTMTRVAAGESLVGVIGARLTGKDPLPPPLLAMVKAERVEPDVWNAAQDGGIGIRMTPKGFAVFLTVGL
jgi:hypothetical protein